MLPSLSYLLLQARRPDDPMREHEIECFASILGCDRRQINAIDLIHERPRFSQLKEIDIVLFGGSGDFSVVTGKGWLESTLDLVRDLHATSKPTFASCWGFQAIARALGGTVISDPQRAELGTLPVDLTEAGRQDPVFRTLESPFKAHIGHQDTVDTLPPDAVLLASTGLTENHAFRIADKPIYCTQFHSELRAQHMKERVSIYPAYIEKIAQMPYEDVIASLEETPLANSLLALFILHFFGD